MSHARLVQQLALTLCVLAIMPRGSASDLTRAQPVDAIWHAQQLELNFRSAHTFYSCEGLKNKIEAILAAIGAYKRIDINVQCRAGTPTNSAFAVITLATPIEATQENVAALTTYSPQQQLVARMKKVQLPSANDVEHFDAEWRTVALHQERSLRLEAADCDLLHDLSTQIFPRLRVRLDERRLSCSSSSAVRSKPKLRVLALVAARDVPVAYVRGKPNTR